MNKLNTISVLFITPFFFGYEVSIKNAIIENGYDVDLFDERPSNKSIFKAISRVKKSIIKSQINKYYDKIFSKIQGKQYSYFLLIKGETIPENFIIKFKKNNPHAKLIFYSYDSINNNVNSLQILKHFDSCYSFDFEDVKNYPSFKLKHLFYTKEYINKEYDSIERIYTISFVGTLHSNRHSVIRNLFGAFKNTFTFFYLPAKWFFYFNKLTNKDFRNIKMEEISFDKISKEEVAKIFKSSKSVLDIQRFNQTGLTMRTFEVLASGAILITINPYIKYVDFYRTNNIIVIDEIPSATNILEIKSKIIDKGGNDLSQDVNFQKYFINNWVKEFFL